MNHHPIFERYDRKEVVGTGIHVFDFLGTRTRAQFRSGWEKFATRAEQKAKPGYPPLNEHYFDWIALLDCVSRAEGTLRMAELGAGWAPWLVRCGFAAAQMSAIKKVELLGVEADPTHYNWMVEHFRDNQLDPREYSLVHGAVTTTSGSVKFPVVHEPDQNYGASIRAALSADDIVEVPARRLEDLFSYFSGPIDFVHVDVQGAEYDVIPDSIEFLSANVKALMIGTHENDQKHQALVELLKAKGWEPVIEFPRRSEVDTEFGTVKFDDGFLYYRNRAS